jgi:hypothetical protein
MGDLHKAVPLGHRCASDYDCFGGRMDADVLGEVTWRLKVCSKAIFWTLWCRRSFLEFAQNFRGSHNADLKKSTASKHGISCNNNTRGELTAHRNSKEKIFCRSIKPIFPRQHIPRQSTQAPVRKLNSFQTLFPQ